MEIKKIKKKKKIKRKKKLYLLQIRNQSDHIMYFIISPIKELENQIQKI